MNYSNALKLLLLTGGITYFAYGSSAQTKYGHGGGIGGLDVNGVMIGGMGGNYLFWGGQGGGSDSVGANPTITGNGGKGVDGSPGQGGTGGVMSVTINNPSDTLPELGSNDAEDGVSFSDSGGGGGGVMAIVNVSEYTVTGYSRGGTGGAGSIGYNNNDKPRGGGGGGVGYIFNGSVFTVAASARILGGNGGSIAQRAGTRMVVLNGGGGGLGAILNSGTLNVAGIIAGGYGGVGAPSTGDYTGGKVPEGSPGSGLYMKGGTTLNIIGDGSVVTGDGATSKQKVGPGIILDGDGSFINNHGVIGRVFAGGLATDGQDVPGLYVLGNNNKIINNGIIVGNLTTNVTPAQSTSFAVEFEGDNNTLELWGRNQMRGTVEVSSGANNHFILGGDDAGTFKFNQLGQIDLSVSHDWRGGYLGFADFKKTGSSVWTGSGASVATGPWTIDTGTLALVADDSIASHSSVTLNANLDISGITDTTTMQNFSGSSAATINLGDKTLIIKNSTAQTFAGVAAGGGGIQIDQGTAVFTGNNTYTGLTTIANGALLQVGDGGTTGEIAGDAVIDGTLIVNRSNDWTFAGGMSGTGDLTKKGAGMLTLAGVNSYSGVTAVQDGALKQGVHGGFSSASAYTIGSTGTLMLNNFAATIASLANSGTVDFGDTAGTALSVAGNYDGNNGTIVINTVLGGDDSLTDIMMVGGDTSGSTMVQVINRGGVGAPTTEGIKIIDVTGQSNGVFSLLGATAKTSKQVVIAGAYTYGLYKNGISTPTDGDWYLRREGGDDQPHYNPGTPIYESFSNILQALNKLPTLQQRVGNRYWNGAAASEGAGTIIDGRGIWGRIQGTHYRLEANRSTTGLKQDINAFIMQVGIDGQFIETEAGRLIGGFTAQYGKAKNDVISSHGDGKIDTNGWGVGGTVTWYGNSGVYLDTQAQAMWYDSSLNSVTSRETLNDGNKGFGYGLSAEVGKRIDLDSEWSLTPQAQLIWSAVRFDRFHDVWGAAVTSDNDNNLNARFGISADYRRAWVAGNGLVTRTNAYVIANLYQEFLGSNTVDVAGVAFDNANDRTWGGLGAGGTYEWANGKYALYGEGSINTSLNNFADSYSVSGTVGLTVRW